MTNPLTTDQRRAFLCAPDPQRYYAASSIEEARRRIVRAVARHEGPVLVVGAVGTGKSLLLAVIAEQFEPRLSVVTLPGAQLCTRRALLQMILGELHLPYRHMDEGELRLSILEHLRGESTPRRMLLLVDEADALPTRLLEELRVLTNVVVRGVPLVSLVLAGGPILEERFADPQLDMFSQRIAARCYLAPLTREETFQYVRSQVSAVGVKPEKWFDPEALAAIHAATGGVPRLVNQLGDQLVWLIEETGCQPLDAALVQQAWSDLQQLPAPWNTDAHSSFSSAESTSVGAAASAIIEFGALDDAPVHDAARVVSVHDAASVVPPPDHHFTAGDDRADDLFIGNEYHGPADRDDDDLPASISIESARTRRNADLGAYAASIDATESLVDELQDLDEFDNLELAACGLARPSDPLPTAAPEPPPAPAAANPFAESFDAEEVLVDPYAEFETQMLRSARQVLNRIDRTFAVELARCELRKSHPLACATGVPPVPNQIQPVPNPQSEIRNPQSPPDLLLIEDAAPASAPVPARQFRRLFSTLEASARTRQG